MAKNDSAKGNPAHHRIGNVNRKNRRAASWRRGQEKKKARRLAQEAREKENQKIRAEGGLTPWQLAEAKRKARRQESRERFLTIPHVFEVGKPVDPTWHNCKHCGKNEAWTSHRKKGDLKEAV